LSSISRKYAVSQEEELSQPGFLGFINPFPSLLYFFLYALALVPDLMFLDILDDDDNQSRTERTFGVVMVFGLPLK
jgi:hypothetical protein